MRIMLKPPPRKLTEEQFVNKYYGKFYLADDLLEACVRELRKDTRLYQYAKEALESKRIFVDRLQELGYCP